MLAFCTIALALAGLVQPKEFQFLNRGSETIWVGILGNTVLEHGGFALAPGQQVRRKTSKPWLRITLQTNSGKNLMTSASFQIIHCKVKVKLSLCLLNKRYTMKIWGSESIAADHSGRAVKGMKCLRSLENWDCGFQSHSRHGCLCVRCVVLCRLRPCNGLMTRPRCPTVCVRRIANLKKRPGSNKVL
jgi:hypothetical protein